MHRLLSSWVPVIVTVLALIGCRPAPPSGLSVFEHAIAPLVLHHAPNLDVAARLSCTCRTLRSQSSDFIADYDVFHPDRVSLNSLPVTLRHFIDRHASNNRSKSPVGLQQAAVVYDRLLELRIQSKSAFSNRDFTQLMREVIAVLPIFRSVVLAGNTVEYGRYDTPVRMEATLLCELLDADFDPIPASVPQSVTEHIRLISLKFPEVNTQTAVEIRKRLPEPFERVFPYQSAIADHFLLSATECIPDLDFRICAALYSYGIRFDLIDFLHYTAPDPDTFQRLYPLLRRSASTTRPAHTSQRIYRRFIMQGRLDLLPVLVRIPEFGPESLLFACADTISQGCGPAFRFVLTDELVAAMVGCQNRFLLGLGRYGPLRVIFNLAYFWSNAVLRAALWRLGRNVGALILFMIWFLCLMVQHLVVRTLFWRRQTRQ